MVGPGDPAGSYLARFYKMKDVSSGKGWLGERDLGPCDAIGIEMAPGPGDRGKETKGA